jgi:uncharacterized protein YjiS (DUF1127 family)
MSSTTQNHATLSKIGSLVFSRQTPRASAERHAPLLKALRNWRERRAATAELSALSDRSLADIGLTRGDIARAVRG